MLMAAQMCLTASAYVVAVVLARGLGPVDYGVYGIVYSVLLTTELIARVGIPQAVARLIAEQLGEAPRLEATAVALTLIISFLVFAGFWLGAPWLAALFHVPDGGFLFRVAALDIPVYGLYFAANHILNGRRRFGSESVGVILYGAAKVVGISVLALVGLSIAGALIVNVIASLIGLGFVAQRIGRGPFSLTLADRRPIVRLALPVALSSAGMQLLLNVDLWSLNLFGAGVADETKGLYVAALNLARLPNLLAFVMVGVLVPSIARALAHGEAETAERAVRGAMRFMVAVLVPGCALIAINGAELMAFLFSGPYAAGAVFLSALIFAHGLSYTLFNVLCGILIACGQQRRAGVIALGAVPAALFLNAVLIAALGALGAALAALLATTAAMLVAGRFVHRDLGRLLDVSVLGRTLLASAPVVLAAQQFHTEGLLLLVELAALGLLYLALTFALGLVRRADFDPFLPASAKGR